MLPAGYSCQLDSYKVWRLLSTMEDCAKRTPTKWQMFGITKCGDEVLLSDYTTGVTYDEFLTKDYWDCTTTTDATAQSFVGFKWVPTECSGFGTSDYDAYWCTVGLMELEIFVKNIQTSHESGVWNVRDFLAQKGFVLSEYVELGVEGGTSVGTAQSAKSAPTRNAFDGVCVETNKTQRWLGEIDNKTFLKVMLPGGYSCGIDSYRMWRINTRADTSTRDDTKDRAPTAWLFYGITADGEEIELSSVAETNRLQETGFIAVDVVDPPVDQRFVGFMFVPTNAVSLTVQADASGKKYNYTVGLAEFEIIVKDISSMDSGIYNLVDYPFGGDRQVELAGGTAGTEYPSSGFDFTFASDGLCTVNDTAKRWLGSIQNNTYLEYRLPDGYSCEIDSYMMWRNCSSDSLYLDRAPDKWTLYGITKKDGEREVISSTGDTADTRLQDSSMLKVDVKPEETNGKRYVGFKWVPEDSARCRYNATVASSKKDSWTVGLMEFQIFVKNVTTPGFRVIVR